MAKAFSETEGKKRHTGQTDTDTVQPVGDEDGVSREMTGDGMDVETEVAKKRKSEEESLDGQKRFRVDGETEKENPRPMVP